MGRIGGTEILLILLIALLIFGPGKLAGMGKGLGEGLKNFKKGLSQDDTDDEPKPADAGTWLVDDGHDGPDEADDDYPVETLEVEDDEDDPGEDARGDTDGRV